MWICGVHLASVYREGRQLRSLLGVCSESHEVQNLQQHTRSQGLVVGFHLPEPPNVLLTLWSTALIVAAKPREALLT